MKKILTLAAVALFALLTVYGGGFYPVALVGNSPVWARTWGKAQEAAKNFVIVQNHSAAGGSVLDFDAPQNASLLKELKFNTLTFLIEDKILQQEGEKLMHGFNRLSRDRIREATQGKDLQNAAKLIYGLTLREFQDLVLLPQARRDTATEILAEQSLDFDQWFAEVKKSQRVRLLFVPFTWDGKPVH
jgi:hypothetical protein